jgi:hypothetical protein
MIFQAQFVCNYRKATQISHKTQTIAMCTSTLTFPMATTEPSAETSCKKRRVVHFDEEESSSRRVKIRVVELLDVPTSSDMTDEERSQRWRQRPDHLATAKDVTELIGSCQDNSTDGEPSDYIDFATALATTYNLCHDEATSSAADDIGIDEANAQSELPLDKLVILGSACTPTRGLECKIIPALGRHRIKNRKELIDGVLGVQEKLREMGTPQDDLAEGLGAVSEYLSLSSKRYARALGVVDGTLALLEHLADSELSEDNSSP